MEKRSVCSDLYSYLRTMNTLLEQDELEERKRKRIKQLEQQVRAHRNNFSVKHLWDI